MILLAKEINLDRLASDAGKQNRHLLVWLHKTGCSYCAAMHDFTLDDDKVKAMLQTRFDFVAINVYEHDTVIYRKTHSSAKAFAKKIGYDFYPSSIFMNAHSNIVFAAPGYIEEGPFLDMLKFVAQKSYLTQTYETFKQTQKGLK